MKKSVILILSIIVVVALATFFLSTNNKDQITLGVLLPLTGPASTAGGLQLEQGMQIAVDEINSKGGIDGKKLALVIEDTKSSATEGVSAFNKILNLNSPSAFVVMGSSVVLSLVPLAEQNKMPIVATVTASTEITKKNNFVFRYYSTAVQDIQAISKILYMKNVDSLGVLYVNDEYGNAELNELKNNFNGTITAESFAMSDGDFKTQLAKIKLQNPDAIFIAGYVSHTINAVKQAKELGISSILLSSTVATVPAVREGIKDYGTLFTSAPVSFLNTKELLAFKTKFEAKQSPLAFDQTVVAGYDTINLIAKVISEKGSSKEDIEAGLLELNQFKGLLGEASITGKEINFPLLPAEISNGEVVSLLSL